MSFYKYFSDHDRVVSSRPLYEAVDIVSGTSVAGQTNWHTSSNAPYNFVQFSSGPSLQLTHYFDVTFGFYTGSVSSATANQKAQYMVYNQFGKMLLGHDVNNNIKQFPVLEGVTQTPPPSINYLPYCFMLNLDRSVTKDRIEYNSFQMKMIISSSNGATGSINITDSGSIINNAADGHHYGILNISSSDQNLVAPNNPATGSVGYVFYEAGIVVLSPYIFSLSGSATSITGSSFGNNVCGVLAANKAPFAVELQNHLVSNTDIKTLSEFIKSKIHSIEFQSVTELNSTIYFCRAYNHEFNYSSNPTYIKDGEIIVKNGDPEEPSRTYITTVGLYSDNNELLAVAKLSEPILKTRDNELIARVRIDW